MATLAVVTQTDGRPLDLKSASAVNSTLHKKFFVPSPTDFIARTATQRIYAVDWDKFDLFSSDHVQLVNAEEFLRRNSVVCITTLCINDTSEWDHISNYHLLSQVFTGTAVPNTTGFKKFSCTCLGLDIYYSILPADHSANKFTPISTSLVDASLHAYEITDRHVEIIDRAFTPTGMHPKRDVCRSHGHLTFLRPKIQMSQPMPTPIKGPNMKAKLVIWTKNYSNTSHDDRDAMPKEIVNEFFRLAGKISDSPLAITSEKVRLENFVTFARQFN